MKIKIPCIDLMIMLPHKVEPNTLLKIQICRKNNTQLEHVWRGAKDIWSGGSLYLNICIIMRENEHYKSNKRSPAASWGSEAAYRGQYAVHSSSCKVRMSELEGSIMRGQALLPPLCQQPKHFTIQVWNHVSQVSQSKYKHK